MEGETIKRVADFFEPSELAEYLGLTVEEIIEAFPEKFEDALDELEELMEYRHGNAKQRSAKAECDRLE